MMPTISLKFEKWKFYEPKNIYVSTLGRFKNINGQLLKPSVSKKGYLHVRGELAHRIVMKAWRPCENMDILTVDHLNHNKRDNSLDNLEWVTKEENLRRAIEDFDNNSDDGEDFDFDEDSNIKAAYYVNGVRFTKKQMITAFNKDIIKKLKNKNIREYYGKNMEVRYEHI